MYLRICLLVLLIVRIALSPFDARVTFDHNNNDVSNGSFQFKNVPSPVKDDVASKAKLILVDGEIDPGSADLSALVDGRLPTDEDEPGANLFFNAGSFGGRFTMDFGNAIEITQINTYSWHPNTRGPQLYKLYGADGGDSKFNANPKRGIDPATVGWKFIASVSTIPQQGEDGGQYGVSIIEPGGSLGKYRYLLFDCYPTELYDDWGNTFYSEVDVLSAPSGRMQQTHTQTASIDRAH